ncbi:MAG: hypothetical protein ACP5GH_03310 [Nitrososphaeria archaeon]
MNRKELALTSILSAAAAVLEILPLRVPFPLLSYLTFDFAEIPVFFLLFYAGPASAAISSFALFIALMGLGSFVPIGPLFKLIALLSAICGAWPLARRSPIASAVTSAALRTLIMTAANYALIELLMPGFLAYAPRFFGLSPLSSVLLLTAAFNVIQNSYSFAIGYLLYSRIRKARL